jgi:hypothetical protein
MMEKNRYDDWMKWYQLDRVGARRDVESGNVPHFIKALSFRFVQSLFERSPSCFSSANIIRKEGTVLPNFDNEMTSCDDT